MNNEDLIDLFAGLAMQGMVSVGAGYDVDTYAKDAYDLAYAMIKEKEKRIERERSTQSD